LIDAEQADKIESRLAELLGAPDQTVRDYFSVIVRGGTARRTGFRFVRGTHGDEARPCGRLPFVRPIRPRVPERRITCV